MSRANVEASLKIRDVNLSGSGLLSGADYTLTFTARGAEGRELFAGIGEDGGDCFRTSLIYFSDEQLYPSLNASDGMWGVPFSGPGRVYLYGVRHGGGGHR